MDKRFLVLLAAMIVIAGCSGNDNTAATTKQKPFIGGSEGVTMAFISGNPPGEVFDSATYPFDVTLKLENVGEFNVPADQMRVKITGISPADFGVNAADLNKPAPENLDSASIDPQGEIIKGTATYLNFPGLKFMETLPGNTPFNVYATSCYTYGTTGQAMLCMREDVLNEKDVGCKVNEKKTTYSSGSPVQVTSFEEAPAGSDKVTFSFMVEHRGTGKVSLHGSSCNAADERVNDKKVFVDVSTGNDLSSGLTCSGLQGGTATSGYITLYENEKRQVRCTQSNVPGQVGDFEKRVTINLLFDYEQSVSTPLLVKHST
ncbi:hypothetical protein AUJ68_01235 [Candidatus Woesearchaeota archaeon CG1_02_57_44]|nr:MAG: hypothetical protein AUJ68_01235 [Candidatus Woesearchaeota archaeon CG1_02_57_44]